LVLKGLEGQGYKVRETKNCLLWDGNWRNQKPDWTMSNSKRHVRMTLHQSRTSPAGVVTVTGQIKLQNEIGNYRIFSDFTITKKKDCKPEDAVAQWQNTRTSSLPVGVKWSQGGLDDFFKWTDQLRGESASKKLKGKKDLVPLTFKKEVIKKNSHSSRTDKLFSRCHLLVSCSCTGIVTITDNLSVSHDISSPSEDCWFYVVGRDTRRNVIHIVVSPDFEHYYPLRRPASTCKSFVVTNNYTPGAGKVDYRSMTLMDRELIEFAVKDFVEHLT